MISIDDKILKKRIRKDKRFKFYSYGAIGLACGMGEVWLGGIMAALVLLLLIASGPFTAKWDSTSLEDGSEHAGESD